MPGLAVNDPSSGAEGGACTPVSLEAAQGLTNNTNADTTTDTISNPTLENVNAITVDKVNGDPSEKLVVEPVNVDKANGVSEKAIESSTGPEHIKSGHSGVVSQSDSGPNGVGNSVHPVGLNAPRSASSTQPFRNRQNIRNQGHQGNWNQGQQSSWNPGWNSGHANRNGLRPHFDPTAEVARLTAEISRLHQEAQMASAKYQKREKTIEAETKMHCEQAMYALLTDVFSRNVDLVKMQYAQQEKEVELQRRTDWIQRTEFLLSEGQKILKSELPEYQNMDTRDGTQATLRDEIASEFSLKYRQANALLHSRAEELDIREEKVKALEHAWKTNAAEDLRKELLEDLELEREAEIADREFQKGFDAGKEEGLRENMAKVRQEGFVNGYALAHQRIAAMLQFKDGTLPHTSTELDFLFNPAHPEHPWNIALEVGKQTGHSSSNIGNIKIPGPSLEGPIRRLSISDFVPKSRPVDRGPPTMYEEFHGRAPMHNGHVIYANKDANGNIDENIDKSGNENAKTASTDPKKEPENLIDL